MEASNNYLNPKNILKNEFNIIKNDIIYNIKLLLDKTNIVERIKIVISFVINNIFQIYEVYLDQCPGIGTFDDYKKIYQELIDQIKNENIEIIHSSKDNKFILLKLYINEGIRFISLSISDCDDKIKLNELISNYISLSENYKQIKQIKKNTINDPFDINGENDNHSIISNNENINDDNNNNIFFYNNIDNDQITYENSDQNHIILNTSAKIWCMLILNKFTYINNNENLNLNLVALGLIYKIILIDLNTMSIYQEITTPSTVYSLAQFNDNTKDLICSLSNGKLIIYILKDNKYEEFQVLEKPEDLNRGEINKVITLSNGDLATAERGALSIWKPKISEGKKKFEFFKEIITDNDTCHLLEVNPQIFACATRISDEIRVYKNDENEYPIIGKIENVPSQGSNSNCMVKINNKTFCSGGNFCFIYIISIEPVQVIQKIKLEKKYDWDYVYFLIKSNDGFIFTSTGEKIIQFKIVKDEDDNFVKLEKFDIIQDAIENHTIAITEDNKIFYKQIIDNSDEKTNLFLTKYKQLSG